MIHRCEARRTGENREHCSLMSAGQDYSDLLSLSVVCDACVQHA